MNGGGWRVRNGGSGGGACRKHDALGCQWEVVPLLCLLFHLALGGNDGTERFGCMQPGCHVRKDVRETQVVLWGRRGGFGRFTSVHCWNQTRARFAARREGGAARTRGDLTAPAWRKAKTLSQSSAMEANVSEAAVSAEACFTLPSFFVLAAAVLAEAGFALPGFFASAALIVTTLPLSLASSASLEGSTSDAHSVMEPFENLQELARVRLAVEDGGLCQKWREEDGVAGRPVVLFL